MTESANYNTEPLFYGTDKLSEQGRADRDRLLISLKEQTRSAQGLSGIALADAERRIETTLRALRWQGANPKAVPFREYTRIANSRDTNLTKQENDAIKRIKNRTTAIRAYCVWCMCGDTALVRTCVSLTCPLHPFRLGRDPFRGYAPPEPSVDVKIDDDLDYDLFEDGDD